MLNSTSLSIIITARKRSCGKVMFSQVSVCYSVQWGEGLVPRWDLVPTLTPDMGPGYLLPPPLLLTSGGHHWRPVQLYSLDDIPPTQPSWYWHLAVATKTRTVGKWVACIPLECCLVSSITIGGSKGTPGMHPSLVNPGSATDYW